MTDAQYTQMLNHYGAAMLDEHYAASMRRLNMMRAHRMISGTPGPITIITIIDTDKEGPCPSTS